MKIKGPEVSPDCLNCFLVNCAGTNAAGLIGFDDPEVVLNLNQETVLLGFKVTFLGDSCQIQLHLFYSVFPS